LADAHTHRDLIGYDAAGQEVASVDLNALNNSFQPH
jgi:hypothetical protein